MYRFASAAYAATAKLALTGVELQAEVLLASARRIQEVLEAWPASRNECDGVLDHATRVWSLILGDALDDETLPDDGRQAAAHLARSVFGALQDAMEAPSQGTLTHLMRVTSRYALALRRASQPQDTTKAKLMQRFRARTSPETRIVSFMPAKAESLQRNRLASA